MIYTMGAFSGFHKKYEKLDWIVSEDSHRSRYFHQIWYLTPSTFIKFYVFGIQKTTKRINHWYHPIWYWRISKSTDSVRTSKYKLESQRDQLVFFHSDCSSQLIVGVAGIWVSTIWQANSQVLCSTWVLLHPCNPCLYYYLFLALSYISYQIFNIPYFDWRSGLILIDFVHIWPFSCSSLFLFWVPSTINEMARFLGNNSLSGPLPSQKSNPLQTM